MRNRLSRIGCVLALVWGAAGTGLHAQQTPFTPAALTPVPRLIWFSGAFRPADQLPVAPVENVTVTVYRDRDGGDAVWRETQNVAMDAEGRYSLLMGSTVTDGMPLDVFTSGEPRWIGITVNRPGETEQPRVHLASVPYAMKAADSDTLGGKPSSAYLLAEPASSRATPEETGHASKNSTGAVRNTASTTGTAGYLGMFVDSANLGNSALFQNGGLIGLGTVPLDAFHVAFTNGSGTATGYAVQNLSGAASAYSGMLFYDQNGALGQFQGFSNATHEYRINNIASGGSINFMIGSSSKFLVASSGNIGLGVAAPASKLDLAGDINLTGTLKVAGDTVLRVPNFSSIGLGAGALSSSPTGTNNTAVGLGALFRDTTGFYNAALGDSALSANTSGSSNTAIGVNALTFNTTGANNTALGYGAGTGHAVGQSNNIDIGAAGVSADSGTIRIGTAGTHLSFFTAGVRGVTTSFNNGVAVLIDSNGQLGTISSSRRFKEDIHDMGDASRGLMRLRPVTFRYKKPFDDGSKPIQYGLVAEEVAEVYPDLVAHSADGQIETVKYQVFEAMLLNEVQQQQAQIQAILRENQDLQRRLASLEAALARRR